MKHLQSLVLVATLVASAAGVEALPTYLVEDLGTLGGSESFGEDINDSGQVAGSSGIGGGTTATHAFRAEADGSLVDLGTLGGFNSRGFGINTSGQVTGQTGTAGGPTVAFRSELNGALTNLGVFGSGGVFGNGRDVNDNGQVAGFGGPINNPSAFRSELDGTLSDLGSLGGLATDAFGINNLGQVTGASQIAPGLFAPRHAFRSELDGTLTDIGTLGGTSSRGQDINDLGQVAGTSDILGDGSFHAFRSEIDGTLTDLGTLAGGGSSRGFGINSRGQVVGDSGISSPVTSFGAAAFLYDETFGMLNLNDLVTDLGSFATLVTANAISNNGYITGYGIVIDPVSNLELRHAFRLTPVDSDAAVSAPGTALLLSLGLVGLITGKSYRLRSAHDGGVSDA